VMGNSITLNSAQKRATNVDTKDAFTVARVDERIYHRVFSGKKEKEKKEEGRGLI